MQSLYALRAVREEMKIEALEKEDARAAERHEWERQRYHWDRQKRADEWDLHTMRMMVEGGLNERDIVRRRPQDIPPPPPSPPPATAGTSPRPSSQ